MKFTLVRLLRIPSLLLAAALQIMPIIRAALPATETASNVMAIVFRWGAGAAAALGGIQAVSGASTTITSRSSTNIVQGQPFTMRLTTAPDQAHYWTATGLPTGLALTGVSGQTLWQITGTPTVTGSYTVNLTAKDQQTSGASRTVTGTLLINISAGLSPPVITTQPTSQTATQGLGATFNVAASGTAPLSYQWRFQGTDLPGQTATSLVINPVNTANAGGYSVVVTNAAGSVTSTVATLTVLVPPSIVSPLSSLSITQNQTATFTVGATGTAPLSYFWLKGTSVIGGATGPAYSFANAQPSDSGSYSVIVSNSAGTVTNTATLSVTPAPQSPYLITSPTNQSVLAGSQANLVGQAGGSAPLAYQWFFTSAPLPGETNSLLTIPNVQSGSTGAYFFVATNDFGSVTSSVATLSLISLPSFTLQPQSKTNITGGSVSFNVTVASSVPVGYQWRKGSSPLSNNGHFSGAQSNVLSITGLLTNDAGGYSVIVTNIAGAVTSSVASLVVTSPPVVLAPLTVVINGSGSVNPNYNGQLLQVGASYTMTASAGSGYTFSSWSGGVPATTPGLTFVMQSNLVLQANFAPSVAAFVKGTYSGLFYETDAVSHLTSGAIRVTTTDKGKYSGTMILFGKKYSFSGQFNTAGRATNSIPRGIQSTVRIELALNTIDTDQLGGRVTDGSWVAPLTADRATFDTHSNPAPQAGMYTLIIPGAAGATDRPAGTGYGTIRVDRKGAAQFKGALADGTKLTQSATISKSGEWPFYSSLYKAEGSILGWLTFTNTSASDLSGRLGWSRGQQPSARYYNSGFAFAADAVGSRFTSISSSEQVLSFNHGRVWLADGNIEPGFTNQVSLTENNQVSNRSENPLSLSIKLNSGFFKGRATDPATGNTSSFSGVVLQKQNYGSGFFLGTNLSGEVHFGP